MSDEVKNRVVVTEDNQVKRIRSDKEIVDENERLEKELKGESSTEPEVKKTKVEEQDMSVMLIEESEGKNKEDRAVNFGILGLGQAGGKIAEVFYNYEYTALAINTAPQDLKTINIPEKNKLLLDYALGGAGRDLAVGEAAFQEYEEEILEFVSGHFEDNDVIIIVSSGGGGSGSGAAESAVKLLSQLGKPIVFIFALPLSGEGALAKNNTILTLSKLAKMASEDVISSLMIVDNAKIEMQNPGLTMGQFWKTANKAIVEPLHMLNKLAATPSEFSSLDPMDLLNTILIGNCSIYGMIEVDNWEDEDAISEAVINNMENGLLASEFSLNEAMATGCIIVSSPKVLNEIQASSIEYGFSMLGKLCGDGTAMYRGVYAVEGNSDSISIYTLVGGMGLPAARVEELKAESEHHMDILKAKEDSRKANMTVNTGKTKAVSSADLLAKKIKNKKSAMGKIRRNTKRISDRRRK